jgi:hypothetical protein
MSTGGGDKNQPDRVSVCRVREPRLTGAAILSSQSPTRMRRVVVSNVAGHETRIVPPKPCGVRSHLLETPLASPIGLAWV